MLKSLRQAPTPVENERADKRSRSVAFRGEPLRECDIAVRQRSFAVDPHAMRRRIKTGHDRRMRRQRVRRRRDTRFEESTVVRERVKIRRSRRGISVAADVIGAGGIESDQKNVRVAQRGFSRSARAARQHAGSQCRGGHVPQKRSSHRRRNFKFQLSNEKLKMFVETKALLHFSFFI